MGLPRRIIGRAVVTGLGLWLLCASALPQASGPQTLREGFEQARSQASAQGGGILFERPVYLQSSQSSEQLQGDIHAVLDHRFALVQQALTPAPAWCRILILHLNVKYCRAARTGQQDRLDVGLGRKFDQPLPEVHWLRFSYQTQPLREDFLRLELQAPSGPLGTRDYHISVEAMPLNVGQTLLHLRYAYRFGLSARWAMQAYLATIGRDKVGFSQVAQASGGPPQPVGGLRGVLERNTVRYYLAIESFLGVQTRPAGEQIQRSLEDWFAGTERYPQQLHEIDQAAYLAMKRQELSRQEREPVPPGRD